MIVAVDVSDSPRFEQRQVALPFYRKYDVGNVGPSVVYSCYHEYQGNLWRRSIWEHETFHVNQTRFECESEQIAHLSLRELNGTGHYESSNAEEFHAALDRALKFLHQIKVMTTPI